MGFFDDISRTRAKGVELIRGPRRRANSATSAEESKVPSSRSDATVPHRIDLPRRGEAEGAHSAPQPLPVVRNRPAPARRSRERWNEGRRGQLTYLAAGLVIGALGVALIRSEALRKARISLARTFLPDDLDVKPLDAKDADLRTGEPRSTSLQKGDLRASDPRLGERALPEQGRRTEAELQPAVAAASQVPLIAPPVTSEVSATARAGDPAGGAPRRAAPNATSAVPKGPTPLLLDESPRSTVPTKL